MASSDSLFHIPDSFPYVARDLSPVRVPSPACEHDHAKVTVLAIPRQNLQVQIEDRKSHQRSDG